MDPYFIASFPGNPQPSDSASKAKSALSGIDACYELKIPNLRVGTLDNLLTVADSIEKTDLFCQQVTYKIEKQLDEFPNASASKTIDKKPLSEFFTSFKWDSSLYKEDTMTPVIAEQIQDKIANIDQQMKDRLNELNITRNALQALQRRISGTLSVRNLADIVTKEDFVETQKLTTLFAVISKGQMKEWTDNYATLTEFVVPRSSRLVAEDDQSYLVSVVLFKKVVEEFKKKARDNRFQIKEFNQFSNTTVNIEEEIAKLENSSKQQLLSFYDWCISSYSECINSWMHLKCLRVFVESVLRYGLPINFVALGFMPQKKNTQKILDTLTESFKTILASPVSLTSSPSDSSSSSSSSSSGGKEEQFLPFVFFECPFITKMVS